MLYFQDNKQYHRNILESPRTLCYRCVHTVVSHWAISALQLTNKPIAGRSDGVFCTLSCLSEDQRTILPYGHVALKSILCEFHVIVPAALQFTEQGKKVEEEDVRGTSVTDLVSAPGILQKPHRFGDRLPWSRQDPGNGTERETGPKNGSVCCPQESDHKECGQW